MTYRYAAWSHESPIVDALVWTNQNEERVVELAARNPHIIYFTDDEDALGPWVEEFPTGEFWYAVEAPWSPGDLTVNQMTTLSNVETAVAEMAVNNPSVIYFIKEDNMENINKPDLRVVKLREDLIEKVTDPFDNGDVIRWLSGGRYQYAAIKTIAGWYTTSNNGYIPKIVTYEELVQILNGAGTADIEVAIGWMAVK